MAAAIRALACRESVGGRVSRTTRQRTSSALGLDISVGGGRTVPIETRRQRVDAEAARLAALGAEFVSVPDAGGLNDYAVAMKDPEGNEFDIA